jgi:hypothetical protein
LPVSPYSRRLISVTASAMSERAWLEPYCAFA